MTFRIFDSKILTILNLSGVSLLGLTYILAYRGSFYNSLFWSSILLIGITSFIFSMKNDIPSSSRAIFLIVFGTEIYIVRFLASTNHFHFGDEIVSFESAKLIYESASLDITPHFEILRYYPGLEVLTVFVKYFSNLSIFSTSKILIGIISALVPVITYFFFKQISSNSRIANIGALIFTISPMHVFFHNVYSYESLGIFYVMLLFYVLSKSSVKRASTGFQVIELIIMSALVVTHHFSSFMLLLFMIILVVTSKFISNPLASHNSYFNSFLLTFCLIFSWMTYEATVAFQYMFRTFINRFYKIVELSLISETSSNTQFHPFSLSLLPTYENIIDTYIYAPLTLLLAFIGIFVSSSNCMVKSKFLSILFKFHGYSPK